MCGGDAVLGVRLLLALTRSTIAALKEVSKKSETAGVRIFVVDSSDDVSLSVMLVDSPGAEDVVVERQGARIYLDRAAAAAVGDKVLDSYAKGGRIRLVLRER
jgi:Fe-S cluster assembly iron-binding protein IscA